MIKNFQNIVVLGAGKSGIGAAVLAKKNNLNVLVCDDSKISKESTNTLREYGVEYYQLDYMSFISTVQDVLVVLYLPLSFKIVTITMSRIDF